MGAFNNKDASLIQTKALSNGAGSASIDGFDLGISADADFVSDMELEIEAPALTTSALPNAQTMTYSVEHDDASDFSSAVELADQVIVQTGADSAGADAVTKRFRLPTDVKRYVRVKATKGGTGDASGASMTVSACF